MTQQICTGCFPAPIDWAQVTAAVSFAHQEDALELPEFLRRDHGEWPPFDQSASADGCTPHAVHVVQGRGVRTASEMFRVDHPLTEHDEIVIAELTKAETDRKKAATHDRLKKAGFIAVLAFIMFTRLDGHAVWVNSAQVNTVQGAGQLGMHQGTLINVGGDKFVVKQNVNQVVRALKRTP